MSTYDVSGGSCTCTGGIGAGGLWHDSSRCPIHSRAPIAQPITARPPVKCPVCEGRGTVPPNFYEQLPTASGETGLPTRAKCRSCSGRGIV